MPKPLHTLSQVSLRTTCPRHGHPPRLPLWRFPADPAQRHLQHLYLPGRTSPPAPLYLPARFAKIKYILNALSAGHDTVFLDADIVMMRNPVPYFLSRGADTFGAMEKVGRSYRTALLRLWRAGSYVQRGRVVGQGGGRYGA